MEREKIRRKKKVYLTTFQIQKLYGFHFNTPGNWCRSGVIPWKRGKKNEYLIRQDELEKFLRENYEEIEE
jgi:hypothetical protein